MHHNFLAGEVHHNNDGTVGQMFDIDPTFHSYYLNGEKFVYNDTVFDRIFVPTVNTAPTVVQLSEIAPDEITLITYDNPCGKGCWFYYY